MAASATTGAFEPIKTICLVGGTHGNESTGSFLVRKWLSSPKLHAELGRATIPHDSIRCLISNPRATQEIRRFMETDLNREFSLDRLRDHTRPSYEANRAKVVDALLGPKGSGERPRTDFCVDFHSTTTSMGMTFIVEGDDRLALRASCHAIAVLEKEGVQCAVLWNDQPREESPHVVSSARSGVMIEVGPIAQGLVRADVAGQVERATHLLLDYLDGCNQGKPPDVLSTRTVYRDLLVKIPCPSDAEGLPTAAFHPSLQDKDWAPMKKGDPMFTMFDGEVVAYDGRHGDEVHVCFVNEAAYYLPQSGLGFALCDKVELPTADGVPAPDRPPLLGGTVPGAAEGGSKAAEEGK